MVVWLATGSEFVTVVWLGADLAFLLVRVLDLEEMVKNWVRKKVLGKATV